jgi:hypothetical protein
MDKRMASGKVWFSKYWKPLLLLQKKPCNFKLQGWIFYRIKFLINVFRNRANIRGENNWDGSNHA